MRRRGAEESVVISCGEVPDETSGKGLQRWTKAGVGGGVGAAGDEGWNPSDSAASLHKSRQGRKPLKPEPRRRRPSREGVGGTEISIRDWLVCVYPCVFGNPREDELPEYEKIVCN